MALDLTGIENVEFYSAHYLDAVLDGDLKAVFDKWSEQEKEDGRKPPHKRLASLTNKYFTLRGKANEEEDPRERWRLARDFHADLLDALGYEYRPSVESLDDGDVIPVLLALRRDGNPFLWVVDAPFPAASDGDGMGDQDEDPLEEMPFRVQLPQEYDKAEIPNTSWRSLLDERIFRLESPPRWVLFLSGDEALLIERLKWPQGRYLRFRIGELLGRREPRALRATAGLLHRDVLAPDTGLCLHDTLDENSHKHAYAVSEDLKHGVRRSVELIANEAVYYRREVQKLGVFNEEELAAKLTTECLTWLYRMLFLFYVEARGGELGVVPMAADVYREGYSLEKLRDLELVPLTTEAARNGYFIHDSLKRLFLLVNGGFPVDRQGELGLPRAEEAETYQNSMRISALNSPLFDDDRLEILKNVRFRNSVLQEVLQLLSLSAEKKRKLRGRISYAQLGINQLGAVYEGILSYTGFFASEDLYEVASEKECAQLSGKPAAEREKLKTYFVPASRIGDYKEAEIVRDENEKKVVHKKGTFIFRLAGRNREKSASYYTPEVLTRCLVKYALKELLCEEDEKTKERTRKKTADEILALTICEPAMGSSAFLIEAVDQLADAYLEARQEELDKTIPPEEYQREKRRVKARLATNNCYGVDLNPTAVELAKVSLWLATLYEGGKCPWFGLRLATGNSLVGARRQVFKTADVIRKGTAAKPNWLELVPEPVPLYHGPDGPPIDEHWTPPPRPKGTIYHFLLPAEGMAAFDKDKVIKQLVPESVKRIKEWRKEFCMPFNKKDAERLEQISDAVDRLFAQVVRERVLATQATSDRIPVWGEPQYDREGAEQADLLVRDQEEVAASLEDGSSAYRRLKLAMDAWCALWFWPIEEAGLLPDRATWIAQIELILKGHVTHEEIWQQQGLFAALAPESQAEPKTNTSVAGDLASLQEASAERLKRLRAFSDAFRERRSDYFGECGLADVKAVIEDDVCLRAAQDVADELHFQHWPLRFAEAFAERGGFDLILGNPPWVKLRWEETGVLCDYDATIATGSVTASKVAKLRAVVLEQASARAAYLSEFTELEGTQQFLNAIQNYKLLKGVQTNLYKCFITQAWSIQRSDGCAGLLHPEGLFDDPRGGALRAAAYLRLRSHYRFINELALFADVGHQAKFSLNIYSLEKPDPALHTILNLFHPRTIDDSISHDGYGAVPGIKTGEDQWELRGHRNRVVSLDRARLALFASLYDDSSTPALEARFPVVHSEEIVSVLQRIAEQPRKLIDLTGAYFTTQHWNETGAQKDGTIRRETKYPEVASEWILSGPHIYVGTPLNKTPNAGCKSKGDYSTIDLLSISDNYLPRTNYVADCSPAEYARRTPKWNGKPVTSFYRHVHREMVSPNLERTLISTIAPPGCAHINTVFGIAFDDLGSLIKLAALTSSIPYDFLIRSTGKGHVNDSLIGQVPFPEDSEVTRLLMRRALWLACVTDHFETLWQVQEHDEGDRLTPEDSRLRWRHLRSSDWDSQCALRTDLERRQALVEIDVLTSIALRLATDELLTIYKAQFPVLQQYERERLYDQHGRIVPTSKTASGNPAVSLVELAATLKEQAGFDIHAEYHPDGSNTQELRKQKIRLGKKEADVLGVSERCTMADLLAETEVRWSDEDHPEGRLVPLVGLRYTDPGLEPRMERVYPTPWTRCDRETDYRQAWAEFERRLGKKMPEGTAI